MKNPVKMSRLHVSKYVSAWDMGSIKQRSEMIRKFVEDYGTNDALDTDFLFSRTGGIIFTRFTVGMQLSCIRRVPVWNYFEALSIFIRSLQGERYVVEFALMGGILSTFELLRVDEMKDRDKSSVFQFLIRIIEGCGGSKMKEFICSDTSYLESVVDCLTMCKNKRVIRDAEVFLDSMCLGNRMTNITMVSKYVISLLPCDFNPRVQALACRVLPTIIHQNSEVASNCYSLVVDALKTDYTEMLVDIGELCLCISKTGVGNELLTALMETAIPSSALDELRTASNLSSSTTPTPTRGSTRPTEDYASGPTEEGTRGSEGGETGSVKSITPPANAEKSQMTDNTDGNKPKQTQSMYSAQRLQYGATFILGFMVKNEPEEVERLVSKGIIGSALAAMGNTPHDSIQMMGTRLCVLIFELSPTAARAMTLLLPKNLLIILLSEVEDTLQYLTAPMCALLRKMGRTVQSGWREWFESVTEGRRKKCPSQGDMSQSDFKGGLDNRPGTVESVDTSSAAYKIETYSRALDDLTSKTELETACQKMPIIYLDVEYRKNVLNRRSSTPKRSSRFRSTLPKLPGMGGGAVSDGVHIIFEDEELEEFRKYLREMEVKEAKIDSVFKLIAEETMSIYSGVDRAGGGGSMTGLEATLLEDAKKRRRSSQEQESQGTEEEDGEEELESGVDDPEQSRYSSISAEEEGAQEAGEEDVLRSILEPQE